MHGTIGAGKRAEAKPEDEFPMRWWALAVIDLCLLIVTLDNTILNVALPTISRQLGATGAQLQWMVDAYIVVFAGLLLTSGTIGDRLGRRRLLQLPGGRFGGDVDLVRNGLRAIDAADGQAAGFAGGFDGEVAGA